MQESKGTQLLTVEEVAKALAVSERSVRNLIKDGHLPVVQVTAKRVAVSVTDLNAFVDSRKETR